MEINKEQRALLLTYKDFNNFNDKAIRGCRFKKVIIPIEYLKIFKKTDLYKKLLPNITIGGIVIAKFIGLVLNPKEIAKKYIYGNHNILTDSQKIKHMISDITNYVNNINQRNNKKFIDNEESDFLTQYPLKMENVLYINNENPKKIMFELFSEWIINQNKDKNKIKTHILNDGKPYFINTKSDRSFLGFNFKHEVLYTSCKIIKNSIIELQNGQKLQAIEDNISIIDGINLNIFRLITEDSNKYISNEYVDTNVIFKIL